MHFSNSSLSKMVEDSTTTITTRMLASKSKLRARSSNKSIKRKTIRIKNNTVLVEKKVAVYGPKSARSGEDLMLLHSQKKMGLSHCTILLSKT